MMKKKFLIVLAAIIFTLTLTIIQNTQGDQDIFLESATTQSSLRNIAEFEPMEAVLIRYPFGISYDIIAEMSQDATVITIVANPGQQSTVESQYISHGVQIANCRFLIAPTDSYWTRDYGPWFIFNNTNTTLGRLEVVDFEYNRPRPNDNAIPQAFAINQSLPLTYMDLVHAGGNYMTDGQGISISTDLVCSENPGLNVSQIQQLVHQALGIQTYHLYPDPLGEYIEHVDCWAKYLSPDTIMIIQVSSSHPHYADIEAAAAYFANQTSCYGTPYTIERVYTHLDEPYINSLILNNKVFVPITQSPYDAAALAAYQNAMPGYQILGFTGSWQNTDALHCRAKGIPDRYMLYIQHTPLVDDEPLLDGFPIEAIITPYSGENLTDPPLLHWQASGEWHTLPMILSNGSYRATIPWHPHGTLVSYYLYAMDDSGRNQTHPLIGAPGAHSFMATMQPPQVDSIHVTPSSPQTSDPVNISAHITDNKGIHSVYLTLTSPLGSTQNFSITHNTTGDIYYCNQTYTHPGNYTFSLWITDTSNTSIRSPTANFTLEPNDITHHSPLYGGWNLITIPLDTVWTASALGKNISGCSTVCRFNASSQSYVTHVMGVPYNDFSILDGVGYFVYVTGDSFLNVTGLSISSVNVSLYTQWNLIGWYSETATTASSLGAVLDGCTTICMYDAVVGSYVTHVVGIPYNDFSITSGMGLFISSDASGWWHGQG